MDQLITAISDFPVILQGALGSALFALALYLGQKVAAWAKRNSASASAKRRRQYLIEQRLKYNVLTNKDYATRGAFVGLLHFRASRSLFKALLWLTFGLITGTVLSVLGLVGYLGAVYYLFAGLSTLAPPEHTGNVEERLESIQAELDKLKQDAPDSENGGEA